MRKLHASILKTLRRGVSVDIGGEEFYPYCPPTNPHQKDCDLTDLRGGQKVVCRLDGFLVVRVIQEIRQANYLPRFRVGTTEDDKQWIGKTKIFGVKKLSDRIEIMDEVCG